MANKDVFIHRVAGEPITQEDAGVYVSIHRKTGAVNNIFELVNIDEDWYLYQLKKIATDNEIEWVLLSDGEDDYLTDCSPDEIDQYFNHPEYAEPRGSWQVMRNNRYGFGKFTPIKADMASQFAMILFVNPDNNPIPNMLVPLLIQKSHDAVLLSLSQLER